MRRNGKVTTRKATRSELRSLRKITPNEMMWRETPRSRLVAAEDKIKRIGGAWGLDYGGKYWR